MHLKQLECTIDVFDGKHHVPLHEYDNTWVDGAAYSFVRVPRGQVPFTVHLKSKGFIAPGLAMFVYIDGVPQCNRNRRDLTPYGRGSEVEVDFRVRQKEDKVGNGQFIGREWTFAPLNIAGRKVDTSTTVLDNIGTIEVVVLRCEAQRPSRPKDIHRSNGINLDGANDVRPPHAIAQRDKSGNVLMIKRKDKKDKKRKKESHEAYLWGLGVTVDMAAKSSQPAHASRKAIEWHNDKDKSLVPAKWPSADAPKQDYIDYYYESFVPNAQGSNGTGVVTWSDYADSSDEDEDEPLARAIRESKEHARANGINFDGANDAPRRPYMNGARHPQFEEDRLNGLNLDGANDHHGPPHMHGARPSHGHGAHDWHQQPADFQAGYHGAQQYSHNHNRAPQGPHYRGGATEVKPLWENSNVGSAHPNANGWASTHPHAANTWGPPPPPTANGTWGAPSHKPSASAWGHDAGPPGPPPSHHTWGAPPVQQPSQANGWGPASGSVLGGPPKPPKVPGAWDDVPSDYERNKAGPSTSKHASSGAKGKTHDHTLKIAPGGRLEPKPYWQGQSVRRAHNSSLQQPRGRVVAPAEPLFAVPEHIADQGKRTHQVATGQGVVYEHATGQPDYVDNGKRPYAVFTFRYRSKGMFIILGTKIYKEMKRPEDMSREELIQRTRALEIKRVESDLTSSDDEAVSRKKPKSARAASKQPAGQQDWSNYDWRKGPPGAPGTNANVQW